MTHRSILILAILGQAFAAPAQAGTSGFALINNIGKDISAMAIRRVGSNRWQPLPAATTSPPTT